MRNSFNAVRDRIRRQPFMKPVNDLGLPGQAALAALVTLGAIWLLRVPVGIVAVYCVGLATRLPMGRSS